MFKKRHPQATLHPDFETLQRVEHLRQARWSFNLALTVTSTSATILLIGTILALLGRVQADTITAASTAAGGLMSNLGCVQLAREASDRLRASPIGSAVNKKS